MPSFFSSVRTFLFLSLTIFIISCDSKRFFEENKTIPAGVWKNNQQLQFEVNISDTLSLYDLFVNVRNSGDYPYSNLYLFIKTRYPGGFSIQDTMECQLADYDGKWLGSGIGSVKFNRFLFQKSVPLRRSGTYIFEIQQAMRDNELKGIRDIGLRIEKEQIH